MLRRDRTVNWKYGAMMFCALAACGGGDKRGNSGGSGGDGGGGGNGTGGSDSFVPPCESKKDTVRDLPLGDDCPKYATVTDFEKAELSPADGTGCANTAVCHGASSTASKKGRPYAEPLIVKSDVFVLLAGVKYRGVQHNTFEEGNLCPDDAYIDLDNPSKSYLLAKVTQAKPTCPSNDMSAGNQMPSGGTKWNDEQKKCLEAYVKVVAESCK